MGHSLFLSESLRNKNSRNTKLISPAAHRNPFSSGQSQELCLWSLLSTPLHISCSRVGIGAGNKQRELEKLVFVGMLDKTRWMCANLPAHTGVDENTAGPRLSKVHFINPLEDE